MDVIDRAIIRATQSGLPLVPQPYHAIADEINVCVDIVKQRMQIMLDSGQIRRIGAVPNHYKIGYSANAMSVWDVADENIEELGQLFGKQNYVSHCYERPRFLPEWPYNLFAMLHAKNKDQVNSYAKELEQLLGDKCRRYELLFSTEILKKTGLRLLKQ
ncbi:MAG: Lrp/AsnC family transcriptional regulator [Pseudomonadota bacterium]